jgi:hypothetical protein
LVGVRSTERPEARLAKVYVSSTYTDLVEQREAVARQVAKLRGYQLVAMENYVASDQRPLQQCLDDVAACDVYVGIFAWRYGFVPPASENPEQRSITELEYRKALELKKTCLIFLLSDKAPWLPDSMDKVNGENGAGARILTLRQELEQNHSRSIFHNTEKLVNDLSASLSNLRPAEPPQASAPAKAQELRELRHSLLLAYAPLDSALAKSHATALQSWLERPILASEQVLFAADEAGFDRLESQASSCAGAMLVVTPNSLAQLTALGARLETVLAELRARVGAVGAVACGVPAAAVPASWGFGAQVFELAAPVAGAASPVSPGSSLKSWLDEAMPPKGSRSIGLPVSLLCMTADEHARLAQDPGMIGQRLGGLVEQQFKKITAALAAAEIPWERRYAAERSGFRPFGPNEPAIARIVEDMANAINARQPLKLRQRRIKVQWYPFDAVKAHYLSNDARLRTVYRSVARTGCIFVVDEMSLFHPDLNEAFRSSPFSNNEQVSLVTLSPFDPQSREIDQMLDQEPRGKLSGALERFTTYYDPQCELAVSDPRRLRRWLHWSLPETVACLREPRPDQAAMSAFFAAELGATRQQSPSDYPWAGGGS